MARWTAIAVLCWVPAAVAEGNDFSIVDFGAEPDGVTINTAAIQETIDQVAASGGGTVTVPPGTFKTGAMFLKQGVKLHLAKGGVLLGSTDLEDYPKRMTRIEGHFEPWRPALVNAAGMTGVRITGDGTLNGNGKPFWTAFWKRRAENRKCTNLEVERPRLMFIDGCSDVVVRGIHLKDSGFWNLHLYNCRYVLVEDLTITAPNGSRPRLRDPEHPWDEVSVSRAPSSDGIDVDSCQNVTIRRCSISVGDDCIALKGTKGPLALQDKSSPPVENITVEDCDFDGGDGVVTCGSEATVIRNVTAVNCRVGSGVPVVRFKLRPDTPQLYENFIFDGITVARAQAIFDVKPWTQFFDLQGHEPPQSVVRNVVVRNMTGSLQGLGELRGNRGDQITNVTVENVDVTARRPRLRVGPEVSGLRMDDVRVNGQSYALD